MTRLEKIILDSKPVQVVFSIADKIVLPGADGLSLYEIGRFFFRELKDNRLFESCAAVTYNFVMAIPPTLLVLFSLVPYLPLQGVEKTILDTLRLITPNESFYTTISGVVTDFIHNEQEGVLSIGILTTLFFSSNGMMGLIQSFEREHLSQVYVKRSWLKQRWDALKLTLMLLLVAILSIAVLILQSSALNDILLSIFDNVVIIRLASIIIIALIIFVTISILYKYGPSLSRPVKFVSPGAVFATILSVISSGVFFFLVNNFIHYNKIYGSIGTVMASMVLIWINTLIILIGYNLNVSILLGNVFRKEKIEKQKNI